MELCSNANSFRLHARHKCKSSEKKKTRLFYFQFGALREWRPQIGIMRINWESGEMATNNEQKTKPLCINWCDRDSLWDQKKKKKSASNRKQFINKTNRLHLFFVLLCQNGIVDINYCWVTKSRNWATMQATDTHTKTYSAWRA